MQHYVPQDLPTLHPAAGLSNEKKKLWALVWYKLYLYTYCRIILFVTAVPPNLFFHSGNSKIIFDIPNNTHL